MNRVLITVFISIFILSQNGEASHSTTTHNSENKTALSREIRQKLLELKKEGSFIQFSLHLSKQELEDLNKIHINQNTPYDHFGELDGFQSGAARYLASLGNNRQLSNSVASILNRIASDVLTAFKIDFGWITIRSFEETNEFDTPRWHVDTDFSDSNMELQCKIVLVLKGPGTLFYDLPSSKRERFDALNYDGKPDSIERRRRFERFIDRSRAISGPVGTGTIFRVGNDGKGAVHSEPPIHSKRLFMSIVPGTGGRKTFPNPDDERQMHDDF